MRRQLGLLTSLIFLCTAALCWAGCSNYSYSNNNDGCYDECYAEPVCPAPCAPACRPVCPEPCKPVCPKPCRPVCPEPCKPVCPEPCRPVCPEPCKPVCNADRHAFRSSELCCEGIIIRARQPQLCMLGDTYVLDLDIEACRDVCHVEVNAMLPDGVSLVRSQPEGANAANGKLTWTFDGMSKGEHKNSRVWLRADREGDLCVCFCATAVPVQFCTILCAKPVLVCEKCGPAEVCPGDPVHYTINVTNKGSCAAEEVVLTDNVPDGLEHSSGLKTLTYKLGTLQPCETKTVNICFTAVKRGNVCNIALVSACNANQTSCQACTKVCLQCIELTKTGDKEVMIGKNAAYKITVRNPGDKSLTEVIVTDNAPPATSIVEARGAQVSGNQAVWRLKELKPGEQVTFDLVLTSCTAGYYCNRVSVTDCQNCNACAEACTRWKGRPALNACVCDMENPICIGETNTYCIRVVNQGSEEDSNVKIVAVFPDELTPIRAYGETQGSISGQTVTFTPYAHMGPRQTLEWRVDAKAIRSTGDKDARIKFEVSSDAMTTPIPLQESTIVN